VAIPPIYKRIKVEINPSDIEVETSPAVLAPGLIRCPCRLAASEPLDADCIDFRLRLKHAVK
jgi:hypothetical protein